MANPLAKRRLEWPLHIRHATVSARWFEKENFRLDAATYMVEAAEALQILNAYSYGTDRLEILTGRIYHPTENQPRSNFKRIWTTASQGIPFLTGRQLLFFRPESDKFISRRMPKLHELMVPKETILLSRSGTTGHPVLVGRWLARFAVTDDALRIFAGRELVGFIYAFLSSYFAQSLITKAEYGKVVSHIEATHIAALPVPRVPGQVKQSVHEKIVKAFLLRDEANELLTEADHQLHELLGVSPFDDADIEYLASTVGPRAFAVSSSEIDCRFDATNHVPLARSALHKLSRGRFELTRLDNMSANIVIPARFKRNYVGSDFGVPYLLPSQLPTFRFYGLKRLAARQAQEKPEYLLREGQLLITTDGTVGITHPVTAAMNGWFGSNNIARLWGASVDTGFLHAFLSTPFGQHQLRKDIYGGVVDHLNELHIKQVMIPDVPHDAQKSIGDIVRKAFDKKDEANGLEDASISELEHAIREGGRSTRTDKKFK